MPSEDVLPLTQAPPGLDLATTCLTPSTRGTDFPRKFRENRTRATDHRSGQQSACGGRTRAPFWGALCESHTRRIRLLPPIARARALAGVLTSFWQPIACRAEEISATSPLHAVRRHDRIPAGGWHSRPLELPCACKCGERESARADTETTFRASTRICVALVCSCSGAECIPNYAAPWCTWVHHVA